jgi:biopolymer transport protein ExbB/TolQ
LSLGMIGTVIGFIYMLNISFGNLGTANTTALKQALETMGTGMGTALYTTATGLVCSLLLRLQIYKFLNEK